MKILNPNEIGTKISTLLLESEESFTSVSPFLDISKWKKLKRNLEIASEKIELNFVYRDMRERDKDFLIGIGANLYCVSNLHAKLYFNENKAIISSMNLYEYSDINAIEIAIEYNSKEDLEGIQSYYQKYISKHFENSELKLSGRFVSNLEGRLIKEFGSSTFVQGRGYLYMKKVLPSFELFVHNPTRFSLKYSVRVNHIELDEWKNLKENIDKGFDKISQEFEEADMDGYAYHSWKFEDQEDLICALRHILKVTY